MFATNLATLMILTLGGRFVISGSMTLGEFTAFNSYLSILIFPVIMIGFMSNMMAQAQRLVHAHGARPERPAARAARGDASRRRCAATSRSGTSTSRSAARRVLKDVSFAARPARGRRSSARPRPARRSCSTC